ncbi:ankyrin repeat-containing domain protein [Podospora fimiseda]|uniref:Ankyrin repeat-containing domain protein n=1 Tax=Podospora fimiseda TaxID=252190 RepID=A0AAN7BH20_9PEZI|nr:ankyrin repeat-containing domain protein [Podospora fimiseda]
MLNPQQYTVGWICAIPTEYVAAAAFLDQEHVGTPPIVAANNNNTYTLGRIGDHNVIIAVLPHGEYGTNSAAAVGRDMLRSFTNVRLGLMVGIAGGAPSAKNDIRLGDVVVGTSVFQYDLGKTIQGRSEATWTGQLDKAPMALRTAVGALQSAYERKGHRLVESVEKALGNIKRRKKYRRPGPDTDRLYRSDFFHPLDLDAPCAVRDEDEDDPVIHYGLVASGNQLMKDASVRDGLVDCKGVLFFEMEASEWQGYAAMMAAAYAKDLLLQIAPNKVEAERRFVDVMESVHKGLEDLHQQAHETQSSIEAMKSYSHVVEAEKWFKHVDTSTNFNQATSKQFVEWKQGSRRHLWLYGFASCGKTVLSSTVLKTTMALEDTISISFYFDFNTTEKQTVDALLRLLIFQLHKAKPHNEELVNLYRRHNNGSRQPDTQELMDCLHALMREGSVTIFVIIDALDECTEKQELLKWMDAFTAEDVGNVRLLVTGRPEPELKRRIPSLIGDGNCVSLIMEAVDDDIRSYVVSTLQESPDFVKFKELPENVQEQIRERVGDGAKGIFRWAHCQLNVLAQCSNSRQIEQALQHLPKDLSETYDRMIERIPTEVKDGVIRVLQFLVNWPYWMTSESMTQHQAIEIIATRPDDTEQGLRGFNLRSRPFKSEVLKYCPDLISMREGRASKYYGREDLSLTQLLSIAHVSVKEYLLTRPEFQLESASSILSKTYIAYLESIEDEEWREFESVETRSYSMAHFAGDNWARYCALANPMEGSLLAERAIAFITSDLVTSRWGKLNIYDSDRTGPKLRLHYASRFGLFAVVKWLLDQGANANAAGGWFGSPLVLASGAGHLSVMTLLLDRGAEINACQPGKCHCATALQAAARENKYGAVLLLLERGADPNLQGDFYGTAFKAAAYSYHGQESFQLLIDRGANIHLQGGYYGNALLAAVNGGHQKAVKLLFEQGVDIHALNDYRGSPLQAAASFWDLEMVKLLLDKGADVNSPGGDGFDSALQSASYAGAVEVVQVLLDNCDKGLTHGMPCDNNGADINHCGSSLYGNSLQLAVSEGHGSVVKLLLERDGHGPKSPRHKEGIQIVHELLDRKVDVNASGGDFGNALQAACASARWDEKDASFDCEVVKLLLEKGANVNARGGMYRNALQAACCSSWTVPQVEGNEFDYDVVRLLLENGANVNIRGGKYYDNALQAASARNMCRTVALLLEYHADVNARGGPDGNALLAAMDREHERAAELLLKSGFGVAELLIEPVEKVYQGVAKLLIELVENVDQDIWMWEGCNQHSEDICDNSD